LVQVAAVEYQAVPLHLMAMILCLDQLLQLAVVAAVIEDQEITLTAEQTVVLVVGHQTEELSVKALLVRGTTEVKEIQRARVALPVVVAVVLVQQGVMEILVQVTAVLDQTLILLGQAQHQLV
jgi:hypothetical protein